MRRTPAFALAVVSLLAAPSSAGTPMWVETFAAMPGTMTEVDSIASGTVVSVISGGDVVVSKDFGTTWTPLSPLSYPPAGGSSQTRIAVSTPTSWFAENGSVVSATTDGGTTWRQTAVPRVVRDPRQSFEYATEIGAVDGAPVATVGWGGARVVDVCPHALRFTPVFTTRDGGARWRRVDLPVAGDVEDVEWLDARRGVLTLVEREWSEPRRDDNGCSTTGTWTANSVWATTDGGATWRRVFRTTEWYVTAAWATSTSVVVIGETKGVGRAYVSLDSGRTFRKPVNVYSVPGGLNGFPSVEFVGGRRGWVGAILAGIHRTDNGGSEWTHEVSPADSGVYGVPEITAMDRDRAVYGGPRSLMTRHGEAPVAGPLASPAPPGAVAPLVTTTSIGAFSSTLTVPSYGPSTMTLHVARGA